MLGVAKLTLLCYVTRLFCACSHTLWRRFGATLLCPVSPPLAQLCNQPWCRCSVCRRLPSLFARMVRGLPGLPRSFSTVLAVRANPRHLCHVDSGLLACAHPPDGFASHPCVCFVCVWVCSVGYRAPAFRCAMPGSVPLLSKNFYSHSLILWLCEVATPAWLAENVPALVQHFPAIHGDSAQTKGTVLLSIVSSS